MAQWTPLFAATIGFGIYQYLQGISGLVISVSIHLHSADLQSPLAIQARLYWALVLFLYVIVLATAFVVMLSCFWRLHGIRGVMAFGLLSFVTACVLSLSENSLSIGSAIPIVRQAIAYHSLPAWPFENGAIPGIVAAYLMIGVSVSCFGRGLRMMRHCDSASSAPEPDKAAVELEELQSLLRRSLYAAAAVLAVAMMFAIVLHGLALPLVADESLEDLRHLAMSISLAQGTVWTVILVAIYAPAALALVHCSHRLAHSATQKKGSKKAQLAWLEKHGLARSAIEQLATTAASFAPLLAGMAAKLIEFTTPS